MWGQKYGGHFYTPGDASLLINIFLSIYMINLTQIKHFGFICLTNSQQTKRRHTDRKPRPYFFLFHFDKLITSKFSSAEIT